MLFGRFEFLALKTRINQCGLLQVCFCSLVFFSVLFVILSSL